MLLALVGLALAAPIWWGSLRSPRRPLQWSVLLCYAIPGLLMAGHLLLPACWWPYICHTD